MKKQLLHDAVTSDGSPAPASTGSFFFTRKFVTLLAVFLVFTSNILDRYLLPFMYSAPVDGMTPEEAKKHNLKVRSCFTRWGIVQQWLFHLSRIFSRCFAYHTRICTCILRAFFSFLPPNATNRTFVRRRPSR